MNNLLVQTWQLLRKYRLLLAPVALESLIMILFTGGRGFLDGNHISSLALFFLHQALLAGWLYQMKIILLERTAPISWDDFFEGVGRYFWPLLSGASMFFLLLMVDLSLCSVIAENLFGALDTAFLEKVMPLLQKGDSAGLEKLLTQNRAIVTQLMQWSGVLLSGLAVMGIILALTSFWQSYCVLADQTWVKGWKSSQRLIFRHPGKMTYLGLLWLLPTLFVQVLLLNNQPLLLVTGLSLDILSKTYFTLLFNHAVLQLDRASITPLPLQKAEV
jgi:hypothetical protein